MAFMSPSTLSCWYLIKWMPEPRSFLSYSIVEQKYFSFVMEKGNHFNDTLENTC